jgi:hypothetical protein
VIRAAVCRVALAVLLLSVAGCAEPDPSPVGLATPPPKAEADRALDRFEIEQTVKTVDRAAACKEGPGGGGASDERIHKGLILTCPLIPGDRNVYFDLVDALKRDVSAIATIGGGSSELGELTDPKSTILDVRGSAYRGTLSIFGVDGAGVFTILVNLDLAIP